METSTASVNSALQRARAIMAQKVPSPSQQQTLRKIGDARLRQIVAGFSAALENGDADALVALLSEDVTWSMPPLVHWYHVLEAVTNFAVLVRLTGCGPGGTFPPARTARRRWASTSGTTTPARASDGRSTC